jgi:hypothetical protein
MTSRWLPRTQSRFVGTVLVLVLVLDVKKAEYKHEKVHEYEGQIMFRPCMNRLTSADQLFQNRK